MIMGRFFALLMTSAAVLSAIPPLYLGIHWWEHKYFPVVGKLELLDIVPDGKNSLVYVRFNKLRECQYIGIAWFNKRSDGVLDRVPLELKVDRPNDASDSNRPVGVQVSGPWRVGIQADLLKAVSTVMLTHQCHPLYVTRTVIFP